MTTTTEKSKAVWALDGSVYTVTFPNGKKMAFDMAELYPTFISFTETQQQTICYGAKQKLSDSCARPKAEKLTHDETVTQMDATWKAIKDGSAWTRKAGEKAPTVSKSKVETELQAMYDNAINDDMKLAVLAMAEKLKVDVVTDEEGDL